MKTAIIIPFGGEADQERADALDFVVDRLEKRYPRFELIVGEDPEEESWSKGRAIAAGIEETDAEILVLHDADSFLAGDQLKEAVQLIRDGRAEWVVPHKMVYRLRERETERMLAQPHRTPRKMVTRTPYVGPAGGGITILKAEHYELAPIDPRFEGWGGEDLSFGWALDTLVGPYERLIGQLFHLWHEHPAPDLRGSEESEALVDRYRGARGYPRRMRQLIDEGDWSPLDELDEPVRFRMTANRKTLRIAGHDPMRFPKGTYETTDPDEVEALRRHPYVTEDRRR